MLIRSDISRWQNTDGGGRLVVHPMPADVAAAVATAMAAAAPSRPSISRLAADVRDRTETAMSQEHCFKVCELGLLAQAMADKDAAQRPQTGVSGADA